jgi:WD40 repeat protein
MMVQPWIPVILFPFPLASGAVTAELQFSRLSWAEFEELVADLARNADDLVDVRRYGPDGQGQDGIDVIGFTRTGQRAHAYQCKRVAKFAESDLSRAVAEFADGARPFDPVRFVVATAAPALRKQIVHQLMAERTRHQDLEIQLWDATELNEMLREHPRIVEKFFDKATARTFCLSGSFSPASSSDDVCPYPGLAPFEREQAPWFFGRAAIVAEICQRMDGLLTAAGPLIVMGPSGAGKSSLLRAGVVHALGEGRLPASWPVVRMTPTGRPMRELAERIGSAADAGPQERVVLLVDQFEEVFTLCSDEREREQFINALTRLADHPASSAGPSALVVIGLRADFYDQCLRYPGLRAALQASVVPLAAMSADDLREVIISPAEAVGLQVEAGLAELLLSDAGLTESATDQAARLPLLAHALRATWQQRQGRFLTVDGYRMTGGIGQSVATTAEREYSMLDMADQRLARTLFIRLIKVGDGTADVCRPMRRDELLQDLPASAAAAGILDRFTGARLLTQERDTVALAHEALLDSWPRLSAWISNHRDHHLTRQQLDEAATAWKRDQADTSTLYRGKRLKATLTWAGEHQADLGARAREFLTASSRRQRRVHAVLLGAGAVTAALALAASVMSAVAIGEHQAAVRTNDQVAISQAVSAAIQQAAQGNPRLAALLDLAAYRVQRSSAVAARLIAAENTPLYSSLPVTGDVAVFSPRGDVFATGGDSIQLWEMAGAGRARSVSRPLASMPAGSAGGIQAIGFSRDGHMLAAVGNGTLWLWGVSDPARPRVLAVIADHVPGAAQAMAFSPAGDVIAVGGGVGGHGVIQLWDLSDPMHPHEFGPPLTDGDGGTVSVAFSPDGRTLATGDTGGYIQLWDVTQHAGPAQLGKPLPAGPDASSVDSLAFSPDRMTLAAGSGVGGVRLWNVASPARAYPLGPALPGCADGSGSAAFGRNGLLVVGCGKSDGTGGSVQLWNAAIPYQPTPVTLPQTVTTQVSSLAISADSRTLVSTGGQLTDVLWSIPPVILASGQVSDIAYSKQRGILAIAGTGGYVRLWTVDGPGSPLPFSLPLGAPGVIVRSLAFSPDGSLLASGGNGSVQLRQLTDLGKPFVLRTGSSASVSSLAFSPRHGILAVGDEDGPVQLWDVANPARPRELSSVSGGPFDGVALAFSPDGGTLASGDEFGDVHLWDTSDPAHPRPAGPQWQAVGTSRGGISSLAFSPHGHLLATGADNGTVQLWSVADPAHPTPLGQPFDDGVDPYVTVAFSANSAILAIAADNGSVQLWDIASPAGPRPPGKPLTISTDPAMIDSTGPWIPAPLALVGTTIVVTGGADGATRLWDINVNNAINRICAIPGDELTSAQWRLYITQLPYMAICPDE